MTVLDQISVLKVAKKASREEEIHLYGKPICWSNIVRNKKKYTRKTKHKNNYESI